MSVTFRFKDDPILKKKDSAEIKFAKATTHVNNYRNGPNKIYVTKNGNCELLKGFSFNIEHIKDLAFLPGTTHIQLLIAESPEDPANLTIIATSYCETGFPGPVINESLLYDFCEPCPSKCAINI